MIRALASKRLISLLLLLGVLYFAPSCWALPDDKNQPIVFSADAVNVEYGKKITTLIGNAIVTQGSTTIKGEKIVIYHHEDDKLEKIIVYGSAKRRAVYSARLTKKDSLFTASADIIKYFQDEKLAVFLGNAHATDGVNSFDGPNISYWTEQQKLKSEASKTQRTTIRITPDTL